MVAAYSLFGADLDPEATTAVTGIEPTYAWRVGDPVNRRHPSPYVLHRDSGWSVSVELVDQVQAEEILTLLLDRLRPAWSQLKILGRQFEAEVTLSIEPTESIPGIGLDRPVIAALHELNAWFDIGITADIAEGLVVPPPIDGGLRH